MGTWNWNDIEHDIGLVATGPPGARLAAELVPGKCTDQDYEQHVFQRTMLRGFSIVEFSIGDLAREIFEILRVAGSNEGFVVEQVADQKASGRFRRFNLTDPIAAQITQDCVFEPTMAFVDDKQQCAIATWWSDYSLICMSDDLFQAFFAANPLDLTLWGDEPRYPIATNFEQAAELAKRRANSWDERMNPKRN